MLFSSEDIIGIKQMMPIIKDIQLLFFFTAAVWFSLSIMKFQQPLVTFLVVKRLCKLHIFV